MYQSLRAAVAQVLIVALCLLGFWAGYAVGHVRHDAAAAQPTHTVSDAVYHPTTVVVATYNALGFSHTDLPSGNETWRLPAKQRTDLMYKIFSYRHIGLAGVQEFQFPQHREWRRVAGKVYGLWCPATAHSPYNGQNCVVWRRADWVLVDHASLSIPYFYGHRANMPVATFRNRHTGGRITIDSIHNPSTPAAGVPQFKWRALGWRIEAALAVRLKTPTVLLGDRNQTAPGYVPRIPQSYRVAGRRGIDFLTGRYVKFAHYTSTTGGRVKRATDHPIVYATVTF